jgi:ribosomal protein L28
MAKREKAPARKKAPGGEKSLKRAKAQKHEQHANMTVRGKSVHIRMPASALKDLEIKGEAGKVKGGIIAVLIGMKSDSGTLK